MPRGDGTGPTGLGPRTGREAGYCAGYSTPGFMNPVRGAGRGRTGGRRGWRHQYYATGLTGWQRAAYGWPSPVQPAYFPGSTVLANFQEPQNQELDTLKGQLEYHEDVLDGIKKRITELESQASA